jgi:uncharacterized cupin superfamily protein
MTLTHWDEIKTFDGNLGHLGGTWYPLGREAGCVGVGLKRIVVEPGKWSTPAHVHGREEEIFYVLDGSGLSWQDGKTYEIRAGDCLVHRPGGEAHTIHAGDGGIDVLAFGLNRPDDATRLPRAGVGWFGSGAVNLADERPWDREVAAGPPETPEASERPASIVHADDVEGEYGGAWKRLGWEAGARKSGLNLAKLPPNEEGAPPHCHSADEEIFVILEGEGTLELWDRPTPGEPPATAPSETFPLRAGHVISRPPSTARSHCLRTGESPMTYLAYGTREPNDVCYYPRSNKIYWRGLGLIARLEPLDYFDGEPA